MTEVMPLEEGIRESLQICRIFFAKHIDNKTWQ